MTLYPPFHTGLLALLLIFAMGTHTHANAQHPPKSRDAKVADKMERDRLAQERKSLASNSGPNVINAQPTPPEPMSKEAPVLKKEQKKKTTHFTAEVPGSKPAAKSKAKKPEKDKG